jgi:hypothetical protein
MRIRMLREMTGSRDGEPWPKKGETAELPTATAAHLVASGVAEPAEQAEAKNRKPRGGRRATVRDS